MLRWAPGSHGHTCVHGQEELSAGPVCPGVDRCQESRGLLPGLVRAERGAPGSLGRRGAIGKWGHGTQLVHSALQRGLGDGHSRHLLSSAALLTGSQQTGALGHTSPRSASQDTEQGKQRPGGAPTPQMRKLRPGTGLDFFIAAFSFFKIVICLFLSLLVPGLGCSVWDLAP